MGGRELLMHGGVYCCFPFNKSFIFVLCANSGNIAISSSVYACVCFVLCFSLLDLEGRSCGNSHVIICIYFFYPLAILAQIFLQPQVIFQALQGFHQAFIMCKSNMPLNVNPPIVLR